MTGNALVSVELRLLNRVDGFLTVWGNPVLTRAALPMLTSVGAFLDVSSNPALASLELPGLISVNERAVPAPYDVIIRDNALSGCHTDAIRDQLLAHGFHGRASISGDGVATRRRIERSDGACSCATSRIPRRESAANERGTDEPEERSFRWKRGGDLAGSEPVQTRADGIGAIDGGEHR
jgi:hypothetical protein